MTIQEVSDWLQIKPKTLRQWIYLDKIPSLKINGLVRFDKRQLDLWMNLGSRGQP
jgi:excisionase family DNA binding protein